MDNVMIDVCWQGFARSRDVALLAESYELNVAPHNYYSHLASMHALHLCATVPNVRIMEIDIDDVPWKDEIAGGPIEIVDGHLDPADEAGLGGRSERGSGSREGLGERPGAWLFLGSELAA